APSGTRFTLAPNPAGVMRERTSEGTPGRAQADRPPVRVRLHARSRSRAPLGPRPRRDSRSPRQEKARSRPPAAGTKLARWHGGRADATESTGPRHQPVEGDSWAFLPPPCPVPRGRVSYRWTNFAV